MLSQSFIFLLTGTENIYCEDLQVFLTGKDDSFLYAASTRNQRIEAYWSRLKKFRLQWWIQFFTNMVNQGIYRPHLETHQECLLFCFLAIIQAELNDFSRTWNTRFVRKSANAPGGKPDILFQVPSTVGFQKRGLEVNQLDLNVATRVLGIDRHPVYGNKDMYELLICYVHIHSLPLPKDAEGGIDLYVKLLRILEQDDFLV